MRYSGFAFLFLAAAASVSAAPPDVQAKTVKPAPHNPIVRVVTISQDRLRRASPELLDDTIERLDNAATFRPDIVCLPELFSDQPPESATGQVSARVAQWARAHSSYVVFGLKTRAGNRTYNSAVLVDRHGDVVGSYNKIHPTENELRDGTTPGDDDPQVFETDFGPIGIQICFDINWWDNWKRLKAKGAQIVFFPSAFPAAHQLSALALMNQFFVVSSPQSGTARIYDVSGETLSASGRYQPWAGAVLPLGRRLFEIDYHAQKVREIQQKYGQKVQVVWYHEDDWFTLASLDPNLNVNDLISEFGLTPLNDYRLRATAAVNDARARAASSR